MLAIATCIHPIVGFGYGDGGMDTWMIEAGFLLPSLVIGSIMASKRNTDSPKYIFWSFVISIFVSLIFILPPLIFERNAARAISLYGDDILGTEQMQLKAGFWGYTAFHGIALAFAIFWGLRKYSSGKIRILSTVIAFIVLFIVLQISITTTFIYIIGVISILVFVKCKKYSIFGIILIAVLTALIIYDLNRTLLWLLDFYQGSDMELKIRDFIDLINGGTGYHRTIDGRSDFQQGNIDAFFHSPFWGMEYEGGGHSVIWVRFGTGGVLCGIPYIMMLISLFRQWYSIIPSCSKLYFVLSWVGAAILLYNKGLFGCSGFSMIGFIIPSIAMLYRPKLKPSNRVVVSAEHCTIKVN